MNTKRIASIALILGLMATNVAQAFADTIIDTANDKKGVISAPKNDKFKKGHEEKNRKNKDSKDDKISKDTVDLVCMQTAVTARESGVIASIDAYNTDLKIALTTRMDALKAAWALTDQTARQAAVKKAWSDFNAALKGDRMTSKKSRKDAWDKFKADRKACHASNDAKDVGNDSDL